MDITRRGFLKATGHRNDHRPRIRRLAGPMPRCASSRSRAPPRPAAPVPTARSPAASSSTRSGDKAKNATAAVVHVEGDPDHPINRGTLCPKGVDAARRHQQPEPPPDAEGPPAGLGPLGGHLLGRRDRGHRAPHQGHPRPLLRREERQGPGRQPQPRHRDDRRLHRHERVQLPPVEGHHGPGGAVPGQPGPGLTRPHGGQFGRHVRARGDDQRMGRHQERRRHPRHGRQPGREPPLRLQVVDRGQEDARREARRRRSALHAHRGGRRPLLARSAPAPTSRTCSASSATRSRTKRYHEEYVKLYTNAPYLIGEKYGFDEGLFTGFDEQGRDLRQDDLGLRGRREDEGVRRRPDAREPALRLPAPEEARRPLHAGDGREDLRHAEGDVPQGLRDRDVDRQRPSGSARSRTRSAGPSTRRASR